MTTKIDWPTPAEWMEGVVYKVPSRTDPHDTYHCQLTDYNGNGRCVCSDFTIRFEPLLQKMVKPEEALAQGLVTQRKYQREDGSQSLMCWHLVEAHWKFNRDVLARIIENQREAARGHPAED